MEKKFLIKLNKSVFLVSIDFLFQTFYSLSDHLFIRCHHPFLLSRPAALAVQDLFSSSKQITAVAQANSKVISTPVILPSLSDRPQPATTNTHARLRARRPRVEISPFFLWLSMPKVHSPMLNRMLLFSSVYAFIWIPISTVRLVPSIKCAKHRLQTAARRGQRVMWAGGK